MAAYQYLDGVCNSSLSISYLQVNTALKQHLKTYLLNQHIVLSGLYCVLVAFAYGTLIICRSSSSSSSYSYYYYIVIIITHESFNL